MSGKARIQELLSKYYSGEATAAETKEMFSLMAEHEQDFSEGMTGFFTKFSDETAGAYDKKQWQHLLRNIEFQTHNQNEPARVKKLSYTRWLVAASALLVVSVAMYFMVSDTPVSQQRVASVRTLEEIQPGTDRALLTLGNGKKIELKGQTVITDGELEIQNINNELVYESSGPVTMNTMATPKGGQYKLQLPDGSRVWLNAESSITYPTAFTDRHRMVELTGEAYFDVAKDKSKPFIVKVKGEQVEVLGTQFNINAYTNEPLLQTTLLEGSVKMGGKVLEPGQAWLNGNIKKVNTAQAVAWKNGLFRFENADLRTIMRQVERWYDIDVRFEGKVPGEIFRGDIERNLKLSDIMELLSFMDIQYRLENNRVLIITGK